MRATMLITLCSLPHMWLAVSPAAASSRSGTDVQQQSSADRLDDDQESRGFALLFNVGYPASGSPDGRRGFFDVRDGTILGDRHQRWDVAERLGVGGRMQSLGLAVAQSSQPTTTMPRRTMRGQQSRRQSLYPIQWDNPSEARPEGVDHRTLESDSMKCKVGFNVYTPPDYDSRTGRYPVVYWLHGLRGDESVGIDHARILHGAIQAGRLPPMIMVFVNGGRGSMYSDSVDGTIMSETSLIKELIPFIDRNYRTIAARSGRAIEGFSMGGFGAIKLACKYPDLFCSVVAGAPALLDWQGLSRRPEGIAQRMFNNDAGSFRAHDPFTITRENADKIRGTIRFRIVVGSRDASIRQADERYRRLLEELRIPCEFEVLQGVRHDEAKVYQLVGLKGFEFHVRSFRKPAPPLGEPPKVER